MTADLAALESHLASLDVERLEGGPLFSGDAAPLLARAPGRLDVMGGFADYSGSLTLELPIAEAAFVAVQRAKHDRLRVVSAGFGAGRAPLRDVSLPIADLRRAS